MTHLNTFPESNKKDFVESKTMIKPIKFESEVLETKQIAPDVKVFRFSAPDEFIFEPGQFVTLIVNVNGIFERRSYSISNHGKGFIETCVDKVANGRVSPFLHSLKKRDKLTIQGPLGVFVLRKDAFEKENFFIATGTGITPFVAMIPHLLSKTNKKVFLLAGYKHEDEVLYDEFFRGLKSRYSNFEYHSIISQPKSDAYVAGKGRVQFLIERYIGHKFAGDFYLCGLFEMIKDVGQLLTQRNINKERIIFERYD